MKKAKQKYSAEMSIYDFDDMHIVLKFPDFYCNFDTKDHVSIMFREDDIKKIIECYQNHKAETKRIR